MKTDIKQLKAIFRLDVDVAIERNILHLTQTES